MKQRFNTRQRNYIILGLCSILLVMAAGYAAFRSQLTINGTSNITSDWKVLITDIQSNVLSGAATDAEEPSHTETTATFKTNLVSPGDSMQYDITVENRGDIDAVLESIDVNTSENEAILFETSGIKRGDKLLPEESDVLTVVVTYNPEVTDQPENLNSEVTVTLNYVQDDGTSEPEPEGQTATDKITELVSTNPDELYTDDNGDIRYYGATPNNYVSFNNELWRIIGVIDGKIKIVRNESIGDYQWNSSNLNNWNNLSLKNYLNGEYLRGINSDYQEMISSETYYLGGPTYSDSQTLTAKGYYDAERSNNVYNGNPITTTQSIGLMYPSDYGYAAGESCLTTGLYKYDGECKNSDYLLSNNNKHEWLQTPIANYSFSATAICFVGFVDNYYSVHDYNAVRPVLYLTSGTKITGGDGSQSNPFQLA